MPKYSVAFQIYASTYIIVEADNEEAAKDKARDVIEVPSLCHQCEGPLELGKNIGDVICVLRVED